MPIGVASRDESRLVRPGDCGVGNPHSPLRGDALPCQAPDHRQRRLGIVEQVGREAVDRDQHDVPLGGSSPRIT